MTHVFTTRDGVSAAQAGPARCAGQPEAQARTSDKWTKERRFEDYAADGSRIEYVVTDSNDNGTVTNSVSTYDLLGRLVSLAKPTGTTGVSPVDRWSVTLNTYDGISSRILSTTYTAGNIVRTTAYLYNDIGEQVGTVLDGVTRRDDVTYEQLSNEWWKVETASVIGPHTNSLAIVRTQLTSLSGICRRHTLTTTGTTGILPVGNGGTGTTGVSPVGDGGPSGFIETALSNSR